MENVRCFTRDYAELLAELMATSSIGLTSGTLASKKISGHKGDVNWCAFSPLQPQLVTASGDKTVRVWDIAQDTPTELKILKEHKYYVNCAVFSPLGDLLATGSSDFSVKLWSTETFTEIGKEYEFSIVGFHLF